MITRDFILRQIHQLAQVLAVVLFRKRADDGAGAQEALAEGLEAATGLSLEKLRRMERGDLLAFCERDGAFSPEWAVALADLLAEDGAPAAWSGPRGSTRPPAPPAAPSPSTWPRGSPPSAPPAPRRVQPSR